MSDATATLRIKTVMDSSDAISNINTIQKALKDLKMPKDMTKGIDAQLEEIVSLTKQYQNLLEKPNKSNADLRQLDQLEKKLQTANEKAVKLMKEMDFSQIDMDEIHTEAIDKLIAKLEKAQEKLKEIGRQKMNRKGLQEGLAGLDATIGANASKSSKSRGRLNELKIAIDNGDAQRALELITEIETKNNSLAARTKNPIKWAQEAQDWVTKVKTELDEVVNSESELDTESAKVRSEMNGLNSEIAQLRSEEMNKMANGAEEVAKGLNRATDEANSYNSAMNGAAHSQTEMQQQVQNLQQQVKNYFGLDEIFRKIGDLARQAMDTVKELDAAMTETAVVTNFSVSDMWKMLPTYTKNANALGSTIADVYNAATLYYQQGLTTSQSMALANETLKMARIGGIEAAEATDMMTAALRGFNMEINQVSAQRINDVYSKLAAITAADTKEIGSAMERTASIASSANMDFETTSAFLAQMIETTREAPENLGTAMKTIIARFQELKVDPNSLIDSEGEALDFNRVDKALKTIGVSLVDTQGQFRDLDDVFLEIASRWDGLSQAQQRYIATMAAGSRQQSRFIAMMQDYDRTMELVDAAYTSEGAGQAQFEKTLESMDSKLNKLKNAWDQFVMGLMNSDFLKKGVDIATTFLGIVEKVISGISQIGIVDPFKGIIKSALTATAVFGGLLGLSKLLMASIGKFAGMVMGEEALQESRGVLGAVARRKANPTDENKILQQSRIKQLKEVGKQEAEVRRQAELEAMRKLDGKGSIYSAGRTKDNTRKELNNFSKEIQDSVKANGGTLKAKDFTKSFGNLSQPVKEAVAPQIAKGLNDAFEEGVRQVKPNIEPEILAAMKKSGNLEKEIANGMSIEGAARRMAKEAGARGIDINAEDLLPGMTEAAVQQSAPLGALKGRLEGVGNSAMQAGQSIQMFAANLQGTPLEPFGNGLMLVGQGLENIGMLADGAITKVKDMSSKLMETGRAAIIAKNGKAAADSASKASTALAGLGSSLASMGPYIAIIAGVTAACIALYMAATADERAFERQSDAAAQAGQDLDTTKQALEALTNDLSELANNDGALDDLIKGTAEWNVQLAEANSHIIEMMQHYAALNEIDENTGEYKYVKTDESGRMSITQSGQEALKKQYENAVNIATANNAIQGAILNGMKDKRSDEYKENQILITQAASMYGYGMTEFDTGAEGAELRQARLQNANIEQMNTAREEQAWKTGVHAAINDLNLPNQSTVENILAGQKDTILDKNKLDAITLGQREDLENEYADLMGYVRTGKGKYEDAQGNALEIDFKTIKEELPELRTLADMQGRAGDTSAALISMDKSFASFAKGSLENGVSASLLSDIMADNAETSADEIASIMKTDENGASVFGNYIDDLKDSEDEAKWRELEHLTGMKEGEIKSVDDFNDALEKYQEAVEEHASALLEQQNENIEATAGLMKNAGFNDKQIEKWINPSDKRKGNEDLWFTPEEMGKIANIGDQMADNLGSDAAAHFMTGMTNQLHKKKNTKFGEEAHVIGKDARTLIENELAGVDFSNSLQVAEAFDNLGNTIGVSGAKGAREYATSFEKTFAHDKVMASALQQTLTSDDLAEALKDVNLDETGGKFTAGNIKEAAEASHSLSTYLETSGMSAKTFADIMNQMADSKLDISQLTPGVVAFANAMDQASNATSGALRAIEEFNAGNDLGSVDDFSKSSKEAIAEMAKGGEWGNEQMANYFDHFFAANGASFEDTAAQLGSYKKAYEQYNKKLSAILIDSGEHAGEFDTKELSKAIDATKGTEQALKDLEDQYGLTREGAEEALTAMINKSEDLGLTLKKADAAEAYKEFKKSNKALGESFNGKGAESITSLSDLLSIGSLLEGETAEKFWADVEKDYKGTSKELQKLNEKFKDGSIDFEEYQKQAKGLFVDEEGNVKKEYGGLITTNAESTPEEIAAEVDRVITKGEGPLQKTETGQYDLEKAAQGFILAAGGSEYAGYAALDDYIRQNNLESAKFMYQGQEVTGKELIDEGIADKIQSITDTQQWVTVGQTMAESFANTLAMRKDKDGNIEFVSKGELNADSFIEDTDISKKEKGLYGWLKGDGAAVLNGLMNTSADADQASNRQLVTDLVNQLAQSGGNVTAKDLEALWSKIITQTGGEGLAVDTKKDKDDSETIKKHADEYAKYLSNGIQGEKSSDKLDSLSTNIQLLANQINRDDLTEGTQANLLQTYLQENAKAFSEMDTADQAKALQEIAGQFKNLSPDTFATAINQALGTNYSGKDFDTNGNGKIDADLDTDKLQKQLDGLEANITGNMTIKVTGTGARGINNTHFGTMARGSRSGYTIPGRPTLTGEEGEELVWEPKQNAAYMVGSNGPQFANISKDAVVWNAAQTKRIKKNSGSAGRFGTGAKGINNFGTMLFGNLGKTGASAGGASGVKIGPFDADIIGNLLLKESKKPEEINVIGKVTKLINKAKTVKGIKATATVTKVRKAGTVEGEPVSVKANATVNTVANTDNASGAVGALASAASSTQIMNVGADTSAANSAVRSLVSSINRQKASVKVSASPSQLKVPVKLIYDGSWSKTITFKKAAEGMNYKKYNSYAGGTPRAKGGLTLTGEEGYEVVWMPGQKQSMIVGVNGPQMLELPPDAVVWPHEQSKKILKNDKGIPAQSYASGSKERKTAKKGYRAGVTKTEKQEVNFFKIIANIESSEKKIEKWSKAIDKASDAMDRYAKEANGTTNKIKEEIGKQLKYLAKQRKEANKELANAKKATKKIDKSQKKIAISYELDSAKDSPSKEFRIAQGNLVSRNKKTGELSINEKYIRSKAKSKGKTAYQVNQIIESLRSEAQSLVDEYNGHIESSKDLLDEVKQKRRDLRDSIIEMFYDFERTLTRVKKLQDQISASNSFESIISSAQTLLDNQIKAHYKTHTEAVGEYVKSLDLHSNNLINIVKRQSALVSASMNELTNSINVGDEKALWEKAKQRTQTAKQKYGTDSKQYEEAKAGEEYYKKLYDQASLGSQYVTTYRDDTGAIQVNFNEKALGQAFAKGSENYQVVEDYYQTIVDNIDKLNQSVSDVQESIANAYQEITDAYSEMDNIAKNVINGMQENEQETIDSLKTLNDSLRDAFSDLIDSVRKELDKQRKAEQNQKTEKDITDRMNRLAMLRADTSGSNAAEIAQLEKEIAEATGDYEDSLEDQLLDKLQDDADKAAEQRERQINILEEQLEYTKAIGQYVTKAESLVQKYMSGTATPEEQAEFRTYYMLGANGKDPMTTWGKWLAEGEFEDAALKVTTFNERLKTLTDTIESLNGILAQTAKYDNANIKGDTTAQRVSSKVSSDIANGKTLAQSLQDLKKGKTLAKNILGQEYVDKDGNTKKITLKDLRAAGWTDKELRTGGITASQMKTGLGSTIGDLQKAGYSKDQILKAGYTTRQYLRAGYSGKDIQSATGRSGTAIAKAVDQGIKAKDKNVTKSDLGGVSRTIDTNGKAKGGKTTAHYSSTGKSLVAAKGSTLYVYNPDTMKLKDKYPIDKITANLASKNKAETKQAINYAIGHTAPGKKINKNMKALISATGIAGNTYKLSNGRTGSLSSSGVLYYDTAGGNVYKWNLISGKNALDKYKKSDYLAIAKKNNNVSREYAQALITRRKNDKTGKKDAGYSKDELKKKGVKKFAFGGLANYTGPAWMDGTPSKPELVLNATDTKNFMALKDVLSEATEHGAFSRDNISESQGDMVFDININVDEIASDYDVNQVAKQVEKIITTKAKTRNVTVVGRSR